MICRLLTIGLLAMTTSMFVAAARAGVVPFDIPDVAVQPAGAIAGGNLIGSPFTYYNIQYNIDGVGDVDLNIRTARADAAGGPGVDQVVSDGLNDASILTKGANSYINTPFALGDVIGDGVNEAVRDPNQFSVINDGGFQLFSEGDNYLGFKLASGNYGYLHVTYTGATSTYTFTGGAYATGGASLAAGVVPEPATIGLFMLGGILCLGDRKRRN